MIDYKKRWRAIAYQLSNQGGKGCKEETKKAEGLHVKVGKEWNKSRDKESLSRSILTATREMTVGENGSEGTTVLGTKSEKLLDKGERNATK